MIWVLALLGTLLPTAGAAEAAAVDSWEAIAALEASALEGAEAQNAEACEAAFSASVDEMVAAVLASADYVPGSLERHGEFFFWQTTDGRANGYSPALRARIRAAAGEARTEAVSVPASVKDPENTSSNHNVAVFIPYSDSYYFYPNKGIADGQLIARGTCGELSVYLQQDANVDSLAQALSNNGVVLINSHGTTDYKLGSDYASHANFSYICLPTDAGFTAEDQRPVSGPHGTYYHAFYSGTENGEVYYCADGTCIVNHMTFPAPDSFVWLGFCLGMATEGMYAPLQANGVEAMIGFSEAVTNNADHEYREVLCRSLYEGNNLGQATAQMKEEVGCPDPYQSAHAPAWPVAVSSEDPYPGRFNLAQEQTVLSTWELPPCWPVEVTLDPPEGGTVQVTRNLLTISPNVGYNFSGWEITEGEATAAQSGNVLDLALAGPCSVTLYFSDRTPAVVQFSAGPGQSAAAISGYVGDTFTFPAPEGSLEADAYIYHFLGWSETPLAEDSAEAPRLFVPGRTLKMTESQADYYAVYGYFAAEDGVSPGQFRLVSEDPEDWSGDYVLTYLSTTALSADAACAGTAITGPSAVVSNEKAGYYVDGDWLNEVPDSIVYEIAPRSGGTRTLRMKGSETYLTVPASNGQLSTAPAPTAAGAAWRIQWEEDRAVITNSRFSSRILQFSPSSFVFCTLTTLRGPLTLYRRVPGEHLYTTQPVSKPAFRFDDVRSPSAYYFEPVYWAWNHSPRITSGSTPTTFSPRADCTRGQILTFLYNALGRPGTGDEPLPYADVKPERYYAEAIRWAVRNGIAEGTGMTVFSPNKACTRAEAVTFLWRAAGSPEPAGKTTPFSDVPRNPRYTKAIRWAVENGITKGTGPTTFSPDQVCTRAEIITLLYRAFQCGALTEEVSSDP